MITEYYEANRSGKQVFSKYNARYKYAVNFTPYYARYAPENAEKIQKEKMKIEALLNN